MRGLPRPGHDRGATPHAHAMGARSGQDDALGRRGHAGRPAGNRRFPVPHVRSEVTGPPPFTAHAKQTLPCFLNIKVRPGPAPANTNMKKTDNPHTATEAQINANRSEEHTSELQS